MLIKLIGTINDGKISSFQFVISFCLAQPCFIKQIFYREVKMTAEVNTLS